MDFMKSILFSIQKRHLFQRKLFPLEELLKTVVIDF